MTLRSPSLARASALGALLALALAAPAQAEGVRGTYGITLVGLPIGTADLTARLTGDAYRVEVNARLTGLAGMLGGKGAAVATGTLGPRGPLPSSYAVTSSNGKEARTVRVALQRGNVQAFEITPPLDPAPDRVAMTEAHKRGVVDPLSALLMPVALAPGAAPDPAACARTLPVFDGAARFDITLTGAGTRRVSVPGYDGPAIVCAARYVPVAGHRSERPGTKFMAQNREIETWLVPLAGTRLLVPARISIRTQVGLAVIEATRLTAEAADAGPKDAAARDAGPTGSTPGAARTAN